MTEIFKISRKVKQKVSSIPQKDLNRNNFNMEKDCKQDKKTKKRGRGRNLRKSKSLKHTSKRPQTDT